MLSAANLLSRKKAKRRAATLLGINIKTLDKWYKIPEFQELIQATKDGGDCIEILDKLVPVKSVKSAASSIPALRPGCTIADLRSHVAYQGELGRQTVTVIDEILLIEFENILKDLQNGKRVPIKELSMIAAVKVNLGNYVQEIGMSETELDSIITELQTVAARGDLDSSAVAVLTNGELTIDTDVKQIK